LGGCASQGRRTEIAPVPYYNLIAIDVRTASQGINAAFTAKVVGPAPASRMSPALHRDFRVALTRKTEQHFYRVPE